MAYPSTPTFNTVHLTAYSPSVGATPVAAYIRAPLRGRILGFSAILHGALTTADAAVTVAVNGTTIGSFAMAFSGSGAGSLFSGNASSNVLSAVNENDVISFTSANASGENIAADFSISIRQA